MPFDLPDDALSSLHHQADESSKGAILVQLDLPRDHSDRDHSEEEFLALARAAGIDTEHSVKRIRLRQYVAATLVGSGRLQELADEVQARGLSLVIFNNHLKPAQERNIERLLNCRVLDRTGLILDIFAQRAQSHAGRLQVELAQLQHLSTRLQRGWSHLERQKGGIGLRGPGEAQLELDRRLIGNRIKKLHADLDKLKKQRQLGQRQRQRTRTPLVALVGYTNAGKSTLLNALTGNNLTAADRLFETLDTSMRQWHVGLPEPLVLADTVGFIRDLPHQIIEAFRATLEGVAHADLLLVVEDCSDPIWLDKRREVERVLVEIGAAEVPRLTVLNKVERTDHTPGLMGAQESEMPVLAVSAHQKLGLEALQREVVRRLAGTCKRRRLRLQPSEGALRSAFYDRGIVYSETPRADGTTDLQVQLSDSEYASLRKRLGN